MLKDNKKKFEEGIKKVLEEAMYETIIGSFSGGGDQLIDSYVKSNIDKMAKKMANKFATTAAEPLSDYITEYIKAAGININVSPTALSLTGSTGPVTGTIFINDSTSKIEII